MAYGTRNNGQLLLSLGSHTNNSTLFAIKYYVDNGKRRWWLSISGHYHYANLS